MVRLVLDDLKKYHRTRFYNDMYVAVHILRRTDMEKRLKEQHKTYDKYSRIPEEKRGWLEKSALRVLGRDMPKLSERVKQLKAGFATFEDGEFIGGMTKMFYDGLDWSKDYDTPLGARFSMFRIDMRSMHPNNKLIFKLRNGKYQMTLRPGFMPDEMERYGDWVNEVVGTLYRRWNKAGFEVDR